MENKILSILEELKKNFSAIAVKAEIGNEIIRPEELYKLKSFADNSGLNLAVKTGGCEAANDIFEAKKAGAASFIAPMIETPYALKKFADKISIIFSEEERKEAKFYINIETITAYKNADAILNAKEADIINGIILGRDDLTASMELSRSEINSDKIFAIANDLAIKSHNAGKEFILGGEIRPEAVEFIKKMPYNALTNYETRKIVFDAQKALTSSDIKEGISKAAEFEALWLQYRKELNGFYYPEDEARINKLKSFILQ